LDYPTHFVSSKQFNGLAEGGIFFVKAFIGKESEQFLIHLPNPDFNKIFISKKDYLQNTYISKSIFALSKI